MVPTLWLTTGKADVGHVVLMDDVPAVQVGQLEAHRRDGQLHIGPGTRYSLQVKLLIETSRWQDFLCACSIKDLL